MLEEKASFPYHYKPISILHCIKNILSYRLKVNGIFVYAKYDINIHKYISKFMQPRLQTHDKTTYESIRKTFKQNVKRQKLNGNANFNAYVLLNSPDNTNSSRTCAVS